jgi:hypothetical protein
MKVVSGPGGRARVESFFTECLFDAVEAKPETHLHVLLNVGEELQRRAAAGRTK